MPEGGTRLKDAGRRDEVNRRTVGPAIPRPVASPQSRTPLRQTTSGYQKVARDWSQSLTRSEVDTRAGKACLLLPSELGRKAARPRLRPGARRSITRGGATPSLGR